MKFKTFIGKRFVECEGLSAFYLELSILESIVEVDNESSVTYGIQIDKLNLENQILESEKICDITLDKLEIQKLARELFDGEVEPELLLEIVLNYVDSLEYLSA